MKAQAHHHPETQEQFLSAQQVADRYNTSRATIWRWTAAGQFAKPVKLSAACTRWKLSDILAFEKARA